MNLEELKKLREELLNAKKYVPGHIDSVYSDYITFDYTDGVFTSANALASVKTDEAVKFFETLIEDCIRFFAGRGIPFDKISIDLYTYFYMEQESVNTADDYTRIKRELTTPDKFLKDIVIVSPSFEIINDGKDISDKLPDDLDRLQFSSFVVKYNEFASRLKELGYELNYQTFEELMNGAFTQKTPNFEIDFSLEDKKTR